MATRVVGLDIGSFAVRAVELSLGGGQPVLERFAQVTLAPGAVRNGEVVDVGAVGSAIKRLWAQGGFRAKRAVVGVANQRVIVRQAEVPAMTEADLQAALQFEAQDLIPIPIADAILDFQVVEQIVGEEGEPRMRILLAAAQREMVRSHLAAVEAGGLAASAVDVTPFALVRALTSSAPVLQDAGAEAIVCIGGGVTNVVVHEQGIPRFVRVLLVGGDEITEAIARELNVDLDYAEDVKRRADAASPEEAVARAGQIVAQRLVSLVEEIRGSLDYYSAQAQSVPISRVLVTGGGSRIAGLMERLQSQLGPRVEPAHPLDGVRPGSGVDAGQLAELEALLTVPIGLALAGEAQKGVRRISLLPREIAAVREQRRQAVGVGAAVVGLTAVLLAVWAARSAQLGDERDQANETEAQAARLQQERDRLADSSTLAAELAQRRTQVELVLADDVAWTKLFNQIATVIPNDVWMTSFAGQKGTPSTVNIALQGFDHTSTARWLLRVEADVPSMTAVWVPNSTKSGTAGATLVSFTSQAQLTPTARSTRTARYTEDQP